MKNILNYQSSEYDCGPTSLVNALRYLFDREEIQPGLLKAISDYTLDTYNEEGYAGKCGTSYLAMQFISGWMNEYRGYRKFPIYTRFLPREQVSVSQNSEIVGCLQRGGAAVIRCWLGGDPHYVLLTKVIGDGHIGLFDPYYIPAEGKALELFSEAGIQMVADQPHVLNRIVPFARFNSTGKEDYAMGETAVRETVLLYKGDPDRQSGPDYVI